MNTALSKLGWGVLLALTAFALLVHWPGDHFILQILSVMSMHVTVAALLVAMYFMIRRSFLASVIGFALAFWIFIDVSPLFSNPNHSSSQEEDIKVAHFNVLMFNRDYHEIVDFVIKENADLISFQEVDSFWNIMLNASLMERYPYRYSYIDETPYGLAVYSKYPFENIQAHFNQVSPTIVGSICLDEVKLNFVAVHTASPTTPKRMKWRNQHLFELSQLCQSIDEPLILMGDLNEVSWSDTMLHLKWKGNLSDSRNSWTPTFPSISLISIPIDHILYSDEIACHDFRVLQTKSSDHFGITGSYTFKE